MTASERLQALERLREQLSLFHVANDAEDHGSGDEATEIRNRAVRDIRHLLEQYPFLASLFPALDQELEAVHRRDVSWSLWVSLEREIRSAN